MRCRNFEDGEVVFFGSKGIKNVLANYQELDLNEQPTISGTSANQSFKIVGINQKETTIDFYDAYGVLLTSIPTKNLPLNELPNIPYIDEYYECEWNKSLAEVNSMFSGGNVKCIVNSIMTPYLDSQGGSIVWQNGYWTQIIPIDKWEAKDYYFRITNKENDSLQIGVQQPDNTYTIITTYITLTANQSKEIKVTFTEDTYGNIILLVPENKEIYIGGVDDDSANRNLFNVRDVDDEQSIEYDEINTNSFYNVKEVRLGANVYIANGGLSQYHLEYPLTKVVLPEGPTEIGSYSLACSCEGLNIPNSIINEYDQHDYNSYEIFDSSKVKSIVSGDGIQVFGMYGCANCENLETIIYGEYTDFIDASEYYNCKSLKKLVLPSSVRYTIGAPFEESGIEELIIPKDNFIDISFQDLKGMRYLKHLETPLCCLSYGANYIGRLFESTTVDADVPEGYIKIQQGTYYYLIPQNLTNLKITKGYYNNITLVNEIPANNCENMTTLTTLVVGADITTINAQAFKGCTNLRFVTIENPSCVVDATAFEDCPNILAFNYGTSEKLQVCLTKMANIGGVDTEISSQLINIDDEYQGILNAPIQQAVVSDLSYFAKLKMYLYALTESDKAKTFVDGLQAVESALNEMLRVIKGELWYKMGYGIPLFEKVSSKVQLDSAVLNIVNSNPDVDVVTEFNSYISGHTYKCSMVVKTKFGEIPISI